MKIRKLLLIALGTALMSTAVFAAGPSNVNDFFNATAADDASVTLFEKVIGAGRLSSPFATGAPAGAIGNMFLVLNVFVFMVGIFFASYGIGAGIVQTAHEGQVLGRRMSAIWMPVRMITGIAGLLPVFGGFSLSQAVMMIASVLGIGLANYSWNATLTGNGEGFSGITAPAIGVTTAGVSPKHLAYAMFATEVCRLAYAESERINETHADDRLKKYSSAYAGGGNATYYSGWGTVHAGSYTPTCGKITVGPRDKTLGEVMGGIGESLGFSTFGYSINSVNYDGVKKAVAVTAGPAAAAMEASINNLARYWVADWRSALERGGAPTPTGAGPGLALPKAAIEGAAAQFMTSVQTGGMGGKTSDGVMTAAAIQNMKALGWFGAGAWYSTLAQAQNALNDAMKNIDIKVLDPLEANVSRLDRANDALKAYETVYAQARPYLNDGDPWSEAFDTGFFNIDGQTGNKSLGQKIATQILDGAASGTGGAGQMNPVVTLKNLGDYLMTATQAIIVAEAYLRSGEDSKAPSSENLNGKAPSEEADSGNRVTRTLGELASSGVRFIAGIVSALFVVGAIFSIYIPFIPFIQWMGGLIQYISIFFEGLLGAPIWAFAHLDAEGEGMGQRTERGYLFLLNMLFRPFLMIFGFVLAAALLPLFGTFQAVLFVPAIANVQGNSVTGVASILFLLCIFGLINITMIHALFNLITIIPDQILGWVGNVTGQTIGKDTDDRANNLFLNVGRSAGGALPKGAAPKAPAPRITRGAD